MARLNPIIGTEIVDDIRLGHTWAEFNTLRDFVVSCDPNYFIEIGVHEGGLSYLLIPRTTCFYLGVDWNCNVIQKAVREMYNSMSDRIQLWCGNCFDSALRAWIAQMTKKIIYCDGGNKKEEIKYFKSACASGDLILAHDFNDGTREVKNIPPGYITPEITLADVEHMDTDATFIRLPEEIFTHTRIIGWKKI